MTKHPGNIYGDGQAAPRIARILRETPLSPQMLLKVNSY